MLTDEDATECGSHLSRDRAPTIAPPCSAIGDALFRKFTVHRRRRDWSYRRCAGATANGQRGRHAQGRIWHLRTAGRPLHGDVHSSPSPRGRRARRGTTARGQFRAMWQCHEPRPPSTTNEGRQRRTAAERLRGERGGRYFWMGQAHTYHDITLSQAGNPQDSELRIGSVRDWHSRRSGLPQGRKKGGKATRGRGGFIGTQARSDGRAMRKKVSVGAPLVESVCGDRLPRAKGPRKGNRRGARPGRNTTSPE